MKCRRLIKRRDSLFFSFYNLTADPRVSLSTGIFQCASVYDSVVRALRIERMLESENLLDERRKNNLRISKIYPLPIDIFRKSRVLALPEYTKGTLLVICQSSTYIHPEITPNHCCKLAASRLTSKDRKLRYALNKMDTLLKECMY
jgi:hypothetical protein